LLPTARAFPPKLPLLPRNTETYGCAVDGSMGFAVFQQDPHFDIIDTVWGAKLQRSLLFCD
jgi:hypothetical protein